MFVMFGFSFAWILWLLILAAALIARAYHVGRGRSRRGGNARKLHSTRDLDV